MRNFTPLSLAALAGLCLGAPVWAADNVVATSPDAAWSRLAELPAQVRGGEAFIRPSRFVAVALDLGAMRRTLAAAPREFTAEGRQNPVRISIPMPDGTFQTFNVVETRVMEPGLQAKFPQFRTYGGASAADPFTKIRIDLTEMGFRAMIRGTEGSVFIDPVTKGDTTHYAVYNKADYRKPGVAGAAAAATAFKCHTISDRAAGIPHQVDGGMDNYGDNIKEYRTAIAATGAYTQFYGGTVAAGLSGIVTSINRISGVYEDDLAVRLTLVANNDLIVYTDQFSDPYDDNNAGQMLNVNQGVVDSLIGFNNYDVGHVFGSGFSNGVATLRSVCTGSKARGVSVGGPPAGDPFDIDYAAHELGHQFGGNHTFNNCGGSVGPLPVEPGSAITIMGYAGICTPATNIASNSIDTFHVANLLFEMRPFVEFGNGSFCGQFIATGNGIPTVNGGADYIVPSRTPLLLEATGSDPNGDPLRFQWEQTDSWSSPVSLGSDNGFNPIWRSPVPSSNPVRTIPRLQELLLNTFWRGEAVPTQNRFINLRAIARDDRGGFIADDVQLQVINVGSFGFRVTAPNGGENWTGGTQQTVTWDTVGTQNPPISAANVLIQLSTDGGQTFPTTIATVPNTGSATITVPNQATTTARLRVRGQNNIFFDQSNNNFTIVAGGCYPNCDGSTGNPLLTPADFVCFLNRFRAGDSYANCDGSTGNPALTPADFVCFLSAYRAGC